MLLLPSGHVPCNAQRTARPKSLLVPSLSTQRCHHRRHAASQDVLGTCTQLETAQVTRISEDQHQVEQSDIPSQVQGPVAVEEHWWPWRWNSKIRYFKAGNSGPVLLLVHGFGVGAWHFEHNIPELAKSHQVYAIDLMGQGSSWPQLLSRRHAQHSNEDNQPGSTAADHSDEPLCYSIDTWTRQLAEFVQQVIQEPVYLAGNSLGGFVSVSLACNHPDLVQGLVLLNSTPFWSFRPPMDQPQGIWGLLGFDGNVPVPQSLKGVIEQLWWNNLRSRSTIISMLSLVYAHKPLVTSDVRLVERIIEATQHPEALDAFASIVMSPKSAVDFDGMLRMLRCPVSLVYGRQDPWVVPMWGQRAVHVLKTSGAPVCMYLEIDGAGHCPHHEAPAATNTALAACISHMATLQTSLSSETEVGSNQETMTTQPPYAVGQRIPIQEQGGRAVFIERVEGQPRILPEVLSHWIWKLTDRDVTLKMSAST